MAIAFSWGKQILGRPAPDILIYALSQAYKGDVASLFSGSDPVQTDVKQISGS